MNLISVPEKRKPLLPKIIVSLVTHASLFYPSLIFARTSRLVLLTAFMAAVLSSSGNDASHVDLLEASAKDISEALACGHVTSVELVKAYLKRIDADNTAGLGLRAVIEVAPYESVISIARSLDVERAEGRVRSPLHGVPIIVKDSKYSV